ncbi:hypothetical protein DFH09DRAFT_1399152 [Mycena vulgaris]|nr:hypothetical protein DFH09DRAFT_1399152 [Mycena vulgaris]
MNNPARALCPSLRTRPRPLTLALPRPRGIRPPSLAARYTTPLARPYSAPPVHAAHADSLHAARRRRRGGSTKRGAPAARGAAPRRRAFPDEDAASVARDADPPLVNVELVDLAVPADIDVAADADPDADPDAPEYPFPVPVPVPTRAFDADADDERDEDEEHDADAPGYPFPFPIHVPAGAFDAHAFDVYPVLADELADLEAQDADAEEEELPSARLIDAVVEWAEEKAPWYPLPFLVAHDGELEAQEDVAEEDEGAGLPSARAIDAVRVEGVGNLGEQDVEEEEAQELPSVRAIDAVEGGMYGYGAPAYDDYEDERVKVVEEAREQWEREAQEKQEEQEDVREEDEAPGCPFPFLAAVPTVVGERELRKSPTSSEGRNWSRSRSRSRKEKKLVAQRTLAPSNGNAVGTPTVGKMPYAVDYILLLALRKLLLLGFPLNNTKTNAMNPATNIATPIPVPTIDAMNTPEAMNPRTRSHLPSPPLSPPPPPSPPPRSHSHSHSPPAARYTPPLSRPYYAPPVHLGMELVRAFFPLPTRTRAHRSSSPRCTRKRRAGTYAVDAVGPRAALQGPRNEYNEPLFFSMRCDVMRRAGGTVRIHAVEARVLAGESERTCERGARRCRPAGTARGIEMGRPGRRNEKRTARKWDDRREIIGIAGVAYLPDCARWT